MSHPTWTSRLSISSFICVILVATFVLADVYAFAPAPVNHVRSAGSSGPVGDRRLRHFISSSSTLLATQKPIAKLTWQEERWFERYDELKAFKKENGHCRVPHNHPNKPLYNWTIRQKTHYRFLMQNDNPRRAKTKQKSCFVRYPERIKVLNDIGFEWELDGWTDTWEQRFEELVEYYEENGNCLVPYAYMGKQRSSQPLGEWVNSQRKQYMLLKEGKESQITRERIRKLENIGFVWDAHEAALFESYERLKAYKEENGNCNVPSQWKENTKLGHWVHTQRTQYRFLQEGKESYMTEERIELLESIGFVWNQLEATWFELFDELKAYKNKYGNCNVSRGWKENEKLGRWVNKQRQQYRLLQEGKKSQMTEERIKLLDSIGFQWSLR